MYNYDFTKEKIIYENPNAYIEVNANVYNLSLVVTTQNILLFNNANKNNILNNRGMYMPPDYLLELKIPYKNLQYKIINGDTYLNLKDKEILLYDIDFHKIIN